MSLTSPAATLELARVEFDITQAVGEIDALDDQIAVFKAIRRDWQRRLDAARGRLRALQAEPTNLLPDDDDPTEAAFHAATLPPVSPIATVRGDGEADPRIRLTVAWLEGYLLESGGAYASAIIDAGLRYGHSYDRIMAAKDRLGVVDHQQRSGWHWRLPRAATRPAEAEPTNLLPDDDDPDALAFYESTAASKVEGKHPRPASMTADSPEAWRASPTSLDVAFHLDTPFAFLHPDHRDEIARIPNRSPVAIAFPTPDPDDECEGRVE